ncbi:MAG: hypothetical protein PVJ43_08775 [Gemmatimonadales bacterium]|jgi:hypothetical protein
MNDQGPGTDSAKIAMTARVIHAAISGGVVIVFAVFLYLRNQSSLQLASEAGQTLRIVGYLLLAGGVLASGMLRGRVAPRRRGADLDEWWTNNLPRAVIVWAVAEGGGLAAMVMGWLTGDTTLLALGAALPLALLFTSRPSRLSSET